MSRFPTPIEQRPFFSWHQAAVFALYPRQALHDRTKVVPSIETETLSSNKLYRAIYRQSRL